VYLDSIKIVNFRNHRKLNLYFTKGFNYITGNNGTGKTSVVEAVHTILNGKSFRQNQFQKLVNFNQDSFYLQAYLSKDDFNYKLSFNYDKYVTIYENGKRINNLSSYIYNNPILVYSPENEGLLSDNQENKRRFLDKICFYYSTEHLVVLKDYSKLLKIKKNMLNFNNPDTLYFQSVTEELKKLSDKIQNNRIFILELLNNKLDYIKHDIFKNIEDFRFIIQNSKIENSEYKEELKRRKILRGAHLDKIYVEYCDRKYESFASFGQKKSFSLASLASAVLIVEEILKNDIIVVLDDLEVGLDENRINAFREFFNKNQVFITGVKNNFFTDGHIIHLQ